MTDYSRKQKVLQELNSQLHSRKEELSELGITGSKLPLLNHRGVTEPKPSKIPRPLTPLRPLPATGYASEAIRTHRSTPHPSTPRTPTPTSHSTRDKRQLKVVLYGVPQSNSEEISSRSSARTSQGQKSIDINTRTHIHEEKSKLPKCRVKKPLIHGYELKKTATKGKEIKGNRGSKKRKPKSTRNWYLASKYGGLWIRKVFGRVHPSAARACYAHFAVRRVFSAWSAEWWASRREWKLNIRAECHDRYRLWQLVWSAWIQFTLSCREKKRQRGMATSFASTRLARSAWRAWCVYVGIRKSGSTMKRRADEWRAAHSVKSTWSKWRGAVELLRQKQAMEALALHHWAHKLTDQVWQVWLERLHVRQVLGRHEQLAIRHYSQSILLTVWTAWQHYLRVRQHKKAMKNIAVRVYCSKLVSCVFDGWSNRLERVRELAMFQELIVERGQIALKRRTFQHWKYFISLRIHKVNLFELSSRVFELSLKRRAFHQVKLHCQHKQRMRVKKQLAAHHRSKQVLLYCWRVWLRGCDHREEMKMGPQTRVAQAHLTAVLTRKALTAWVEYTNHRRVRHHHYSVADEQFKTNAIPRCFRVLVENVKVQRYKRTLQERANEFHRETVLNIVFYKWRSQSQFRQDLRMLERIAILHDEEVKKRSLLKMWRARTMERIRHFSQEREADSQYWHWKVGRAFCKWNYQLKSLLARREQLCRASNHHDSTLTRSAWSAWMTYMDKRNRSKRRKMIAGNHYKTVVSRKILRAWKANHISSGHKRARVQTALCYFKSGLQRKALRSWLTFVCQERVRKEKHFTALGHFKTVTLKKCLRVWLVRTSESIASRSKEDQLVEESILILTNARLYRVLYHWRCFTVNSVASRSALRRAHSQYSYTLKRKCFSAWWEYRRQRFKVALLTRQGEWFMRNRILSAAYSQWRVQFMSSLVLRQASVRALWHWSEGLQRRCLTAWVLHTLERRRKKQRYSEALQRYRKRLITIGVTQWIKVASQLQAQREATALQLQAKTTQKVLKCVRRCGTHWLALTKRRLGNFQYRQHRPTQSHTHKQLCSRNEVHETTGEWASLLKILQIPDGSRTERPKPRQHPSDTISVTLHDPHLPHPHNDTVTPHVPHPRNDTVTPRPHNDAQPRQPFLPQPHLPDHNLPPHGSFTFLTSTCGEPSQIIESDSSRHTYTVTVDPHQQEHSSNGSTIESPRSPHFQPQLLLMTHPDSTRKDSSSETFAASMDTDSEVAESSSAECLPRDEPPAFPPSLADPVVQRELVITRDALKHFHQLKTRKRLLEKELQSLTDQDSSEELFKLKQELEVLSRTISVNEPLIKQCALRVSQLLAQTGLI